MKVSAVTYANLVASFTEKLDHMQREGIIHDFHINSYVVGSPNEKKDYNYIRIHINDFAMNPERFPKEEFEINPKQGLEFSEFTLSAFNNHLNSLIKENYEKDRGESFFGKFFIDR